MWSLYGYPCSSEEELDHLINDFLACEEQVVTAEILIVAEIYDTSVAEAEEQSDPGPGSVVHGVER